MRYVGVLGRNEDLLLWAAAVMGVSGFSEVAKFAVHLWATSIPVAVMVYRVSDQLRSLR